MYLHSPYDISIKDIPEPQCKPGEVKVKVEAAGICGSDVAAYKGTSPLCSYPRIIGHEIIGSIVEINGEPRGFQEGDRVVLEPYIYCGSCYPCRKGRTNCCENLKVLGVHTDGGMCDYFCHPLSLVHKIDEGKVSLAELALIEPLSIALHANHRVDVKAEEYILIMGAGAIGNLAGQVALAYGAHPIIVDLVDSRLELAQSVGIKDTINPKDGNVVKKVEEITNGRMAECIIEATGSPTVLRSLFDLIAYTGRISLVGWPKEEVNLATRLITFKEIAIYGSRNSVKEFPEAIELITKQRVNVKALISKVVDGNELAMYVKLLAENPEEYLKVVGLF